MVTTHKEIKSTVMYIILVIVGVVMLFPVFWMLLACFKTNNEIFGSLSLLPSSWSFEAFAKGWETTGTFTYTRYFSNTFLLVLPTVLLTIVSCSLVAYGFARFDFRGKNVLFMILITTLMLPNSVIIIPRYIYFKQLGWLDSYMPFWIPALLGCTTFFNYMFIQFFRGLPLELDESAKLDGCNSFRILIQILLPLCKSAIFSAIVFQFVWIWNDFLNTLIYVSSVVKYPVSLGLRMSMDIATEFDWNQIMAMSLISILPPVIIFFAAQKYFVEGIATTGMKN